MGPGIPDEYSRTDEGRGEQREGRGRESRGGAKCTATIRATSFHSRLSTTASYPPRFVTERWSVARSISEPQITGLIFHFLPVSEMKEENELRHSVLDLFSPRWQSSWTLWTRVLNLKVEESTA